MIATAITGFNRREKWYFIRLNFIVSLIIRWNLSWELLQLLCVYSYRRAMKRKLIYFLPSWWSHETVSDNRSVWFVAYSPICSIAHRMLKNFPHGNIQSYFYTNDFFFFWMMMTQECLTIEVNKKISIHSNWQENQILQSIVILSGQMMTRSYINDLAHVGTKFYRFLNFCRENYRWIESFVTSSSLWHVFAPHLLAFIQIKILDRHVSNPEFHSSFGFLSTRTERTDSDQKKDLSNLHLC